MATHSSILAQRIPMNRGAWWAAVHGVAKNWTRLSDKAHTAVLVSGEQRRDSAIHIHVSPDTDIF